MPLPSKPRKINQCGTHNVARHIAAAASNRNFHSQISNKAWNKKNQQEPNG